MRLTGLLAGLIAVTLLGACQPGSFGSSSGQSGSIVLNVHWPLSTQFQAASAASGTLTPSGAPRAPANTPTGVFNMRITVTGSGIASPIVRVVGTTPGNPGTASIHEVPAGPNRGVLLEGFDAGMVTRLFVGQQFGITVTAGGDPAPTPVTMGFPIQAIAAGNNHSVALANDATSTVWAWGDNSKGQVGDGTFAGPRNKATIVCADGNSAPCNSTAAQLAGITAISSSSTADHTLAVGPSGALFAWGANGFGQLGDGSTTSGNVPHPVCTAATTPPSCNSSSSLEAVTLAAVGSAHSIALASGTLKVWGANDVGQLGLGTTAASLVAVTGPTPTGTIASLAAGGSDSAYVTDTGVVNAWGDNRYNTLSLSPDPPGGPSDCTGTPCATSPIATSASPSVTSTTALATNGTVLAFLQSDKTSWGRGFFGQGQLGSQMTPTSSACNYSSSSTNCTDTKAVQVCTVSDSGLTSCPAPLANLKAIALGGTHSLALLNDGTVWAWGSNLSGQLGIGNHDNSLGSELFPVQVCAPGETSIWDGINLLLTPCSAFLNGVTAIAAGANFSMALLSNGAVVTWGDNQKDQLGTSTTEGCDTSGGTNYVQACSSTPIPVAW